MRLRNVKDAKEKIEKSGYFVKNPENNYGKWSNLFNNSNPINLEIGCGKGKFIVESAKENKHINFIGLERSESIILRAIEKAEKESLTNLKFICVDAAKLDDVFSKEINTIYLNFSDPWPKKRHAKRRLTHENFLNIYDKIFKDKNEIIMKTDNDDLFCFSVESFSKCGYIVNDMYIDLHSKNVKNIETEYETKFSKSGFTIKYVKVNK